MNKDDSNKKKETDHNQESESDIELIITILDFDDLLADFVQIDSGVTVRGGHHIIYEDGSKEIKRKGEM